MLSAKPWKFDAVVRFCAGVLISSVFLSAAAVSLLHVVAAPAGYPAPAIVCLSAAAGCLIASVILLQREWDDDHFLRSVGWMLGALYVGLILLWLGNRFQPAARADISTTARIAVAVICFQGAALLLTRGFLREHGTGWREGFGLADNGVRAALVGGMCGLGAMPLMAVIQRAISLALEALGLSAPEQEAVQLLRDSPTLGRYLVLGVTAIVIAPVAEEVLFRGILYPAAGRVVSRRVAAVLTAVLFGLIHGNLGAFVPLVFFALVLVWLYEQSGNLLAPIAAHMVFNLVNFIILVLTKEQTLPLPK